MDSEIRPLLQPGTTLDGLYRVEALIGIGGYAQVYRAVQSDNGRPVALKVLDLSKDPRAADEIRRSFIREAQLAAQLVHSAIVSTFNHGVAPGGLPYMVLELLDGRNLTDTLRKVGPFTLVRALPLMIECLDGLALAHDKGVVHRDLKPGNIFVRAPITDPRRLCILDFGMAFLEGSTKRRQTARGLLYGTPSYMAPEYIQKGLVSPALDVYQMGLVLVEMIKGRPAVDDLNPTTCFQRHQAGDLDVPPELWTSPIGSALKKALRANPTRRFAHAALFRDALRAALPALVAEAGPLARSGAPDSTPRLRPIAPAARSRAPNSDSEHGALGATGDYDAVRLHPIAEIRKRFGNPPAAPAEEPIPAAESWTDWHVEVDLGDGDELASSDSGGTPTLQLTVQRRDEPYEDEDPA